MVFEIFSELSRWSFGGPHVFSSLFHVAPSFPFCTPHVFSSLFHVAPSFPFGSPHVVASFPVGFSG
jgi:hypothetical protein